MFLPHENRVSSHPIFPEDRGDSSHFSNPVPTKWLYHLVGGGMSSFLLPIDELIFFRGVGIPPTSHALSKHWLPNSFRRFYIIPILLDPNLHVLSPLNSHEILIESH